MHEKKNNEPAMTIAAPESRHWQTDVIVAIRISKAEFVILRHNFWCCAAKSTHTHPLVCLYILLHIYNAICKGYIYIYKYINFYGGRVGATFTHFDEHLQYISESHTHAHGNEHRT